MAVPRYNEFYGVFLKELEDGRVHDYKEMKSNIAEKLGLNSGDLSEMIPSGRQTLFDNRLG